MNLVPIDAGGTPPELSGGDASTGGSSTDGPRSIHVQWRDLAGNWSVPIVIEAQVLDPDTTATPAER